MKCSSCGRGIPPGDKYCVYCGSTTGFLPIRMLRGWIGSLPVWARLAGAITILASVGVGVAFTLSDDSKSTTPVPTAAPLASFQLKEAADAPIPYANVNSKYTSSEPTIDAKLTPGEWTEPAFTKSFEYLIGNVSKGGEMVGYFMNDDEYLYVAVTVSADDFREDVFKQFEMEGVNFSLELRFDGDGDGVIRSGDDIRTIRPHFWESSNPGYNYYDNGSFDEESTMFYMSIAWGQTNGEGTMSYPGQTTTYTYELSVPLSSGNSNDLNLKPGDTIGVKVIFREGQDLANNSWRPYESIGWPVARGILDGRTYGKITLAIKPTY